MKNNEITEYFEEVELTEEYDGYFCSVSEVITIAILGSMCGLRNVKQIHQWASNERVSEFLREEFRINHVQCYYWILCLLGLVKPESLNHCFIDFRPNCLFFLTKKLFYDIINMHYVYYTIF